MSVESDTKDVLENAVDSSLSVDVIVDDTLPILNSLNITNVGGIFIAFPNFFKIGDKISVIANLTEDNQITAVADFSNFIIGASSVEGFCAETDDDEHICTWLTDSIDIAASDIVTFNFTDSAGNLLIVTRELNSFGLVDDALPDFWDNNVECSPATLLLVPLPPAYRRP